MLRASVVAEHAGVPSVSLIGENWERMAHAIMESMDVRGLPMAVCQGHLTHEDHIRSDIDLRGTVEQIVNGLCNQHRIVDPSVAEPEPRDVVATGTFDEVNARFYEAGWTDGLPVVPPTVERVDAFLGQTDRPPDEVLGTLLPEGRQLTVFNAAVNGVMAGCAPRYMPVLLAVAEAVAHPTFRLEDYGAGPGWEPLIIASGPIIEQLDLNFGPGAMKTGRHSNTTIGRFLRLLICNVAGLRIPPSTTDLASFGNPFNPVLAENEEHVRSIGWPTFGEDRGLAPGQSGVTVQGVVAMSPPMFPTPDTGAPESLLEHMVQVFGNAMCGWWAFTGALYGQWHPLLLFSPVAASGLADAGWSKDDVRRHLHEQCRIPASTLERRGAFLDLNIARNVEQGILPETYLESDDPDRPVPIFVRPETIGIVVAGRAITAYQRGLMQSHEQGAPVTRPIG